MEVEILAGLQGGSKDQKKAAHVKGSVRTQMLSITVTTSTFPKLFLFYYVHTGDLIDSTWQSCKAGIIASILQGRKRKLREVKECVEGSMLSKRRGRDSYPDRADFPSWENFQSELVACPLMASAIQMRL